jgi:hypothetical protein
MADEHCIRPDVLRKLIRVVIDNYRLERPPSETKKLMEHQLMLVQE